jgi:hypothetical protein
MTPKRGGLVPAAPRGGGWSGLSIAPTQNELHTTEELAEESPNCTTPSNRSNIEPLYIGVWLTAGYLHFVFRLQGESFTQLYTMIPAKRVMAVTTVLGIVGIVLRYLFGH